MVAQRVGANGGYSAGYKVYAIPLIVHKKALARGSFTLHFCFRRRRRRFCFKHYHFIRAVAGDKRGCRGE